MFPNVRLLIAATIASVVALSCGFAVFGALRVNHDPLARSAAPPLRLLASLSPSRPIMAAVEPFDREARPSEPSGAIDLADTPARTPPANDQMAATPPAEPDAPPVATSDATSSPPAPPSPPAPDAGAERETVASPAGIAAGGTSTPAPAQTPGVAAVPAPADQSVVIDEAGQETEFVPAALPRPAAKPTKAAAKRKTARAHAAAKIRYARRVPPSAPNGVGSSTTQESPPPIGGPFVSPWAH
jgi:hypothetical protein